MNGNQSEIILPIPSLLYYPNFLGIEDRNLKISLEDVTTNEILNYIIDLDTLQISI